MNAVLTVCREAVQANRPERKAEVQDLPFPGKGEHDQLDRDRAIGVAERMGLLEGEATELVDALRELGASTDDGSLLMRLREADLDEETLVELELLLRCRPPSAEETVRALRAAYSSAYHQWEGHAGECGWALYSDLIPVLINPIVSLGTGVARFAAAKLAVDLARIFGYSIDGYYAANWIRILDPGTVGSAPSLRAVAVRSEDISRLGVDGVLSGDLEKPITVERHADNPAPPN